ASSRRRRAASYEPPHDLFAQDAQILRLFVIALAADADPEPRGAGLRHLLAAGDPVARVAREREAIERVLREAEGFHPLGILSLVQHVVVEDVVVEVGLD